MAHDIVLAVGYIQTLTGALSGIRSAPSAPPEQAAAFPFAASYISAVSVSQQALNSRTHLYTITTEIHVARKDLPRSVATINPYATLFPDAIWDNVTLNGYVDTVLSCAGQLIVSSWAAIETIAWQFQTGVKIR